jgi:putative membrane protein
MKLLLFWFLSALAISFIAAILPGVKVKNFTTSLIVAAAYGILHVLLSKLLIFLSFIPVVLTFGLFIFVINAFILYLVDKLIEDFEISGFFLTIIAAALLTIANNGIRYLVHP